MNFNSYKRIVVKVGSALLVDQDKGIIRAEWLTSLCEDLATLSKHADIMIVSSGAIALGRRVLGLPKGPLSLDQSQAAASVGQIALSKAWNDEIMKRGQVAAQILLSFTDTEERLRYLNARATMTRLLDLKCVPIINENDTVATREIRYGDNDRLAARVASMMSADCLILLSDIDGLYTANPALDPNASHIASVDAITSEIETMASGAASEDSRGGMKTKIDAARMATSSGCAMVIASGKALRPIDAFVSGEARCTVFKPSTTPLAARKKWIVTSMIPSGSVTVDDGAGRALRNGSSLLPAGIISVSGDFQRGDVIAILKADGSEFARGLASHDVHDARKILGLKSEEISKILGHPFQAELIHRDNLVML